MGREIYPAMSGGMRALKMLDVLSNNLANVNTTGFKGDRATFALHAPEGGTGFDPDSAEARLAAAWNTLDGEATDFSQGSLQPSGSSTHMALLGEGFFAVEGTDGEVRLTRDGSFTLDVDGYLSTRHGERVLDDKGQAVLVPPGDLVIEGSGEMKVNGNRIAQLGVLDVEDPDTISKVGGGRWELAQGTATIAAEGTLVRQSHLEGSNVEPVRALTELIAISRYYEAFTKSLDTSTELDQQLNTSVGRIDR